MATEDISHHLGKTDLWCSLTPSLVWFISQVHHTTQYSGSLPHCHRQGQVWLFWPTQAAKLRFATSFCLLPSHHLTCEPAGWLYQLWPAGQKSQSLLSSCVFCENHLRTQNLLTALGCCQTSVLNRGWRIHTGLSLARRYVGGQVSLTPNSQKCLFFFSNPPCMSSAV